MSSPDVVTRTPERRAGLRSGVTMVAGVAALAAALRAGLDVDALLAAAFVAVLAAAAVVDIEERRVPNRLVLSATGVALAAQALLHGDRFLECLAAGAGAAGLFLAANLVSRRAVGMGDVKLVLLMGIVLGEAIVVALLVTGLSGAVAGIVMIANGGLAARKRTMPYAPFLAAGGVAALLLGVPPFYGQ